MTNVTKIPFPELILAGDWYDTVYVIVTDIEQDQNAHDSVVEEEIRKLQQEFRAQNHHTVSLREVKRKRMYSGLQYFTLVQFRVRDVY